MSVAGELSAGIAVANFLVVVGKYVKKHTDKERAGCILTDARNVVQSEENTRRFQVVNRLRPDIAENLESIRDEVLRNLGVAERDFTTISKRNIRIRVKIAKHALRSAKDFEAQLHRESAQVQFDEDRRQRPLLKKTAQIMDSTENKLSIFNPSTLSSDETTGRIGHNVTFKGRASSIALKQADGTVLSIGELDGEMGFELNSDISKLVSDGRADIVADIQIESDGQTKDVTLPMKLLEAEAVVNTVTEHLASQNPSPCPDAVDSLDTEIRRLDLN
jgi:hypothetical protein